MKKRHVIFGIIFASLLATSAWSGSFTVGVEATEYLPIFKGDSGGYSGYARELLDAFAENYVHTFTDKPLPFARLFDEFAMQKSVDFNFHDNAYWAANSKKGITIFYSKGLVAVPERLMVLPANKGKGTVAKIGVPRGFTPFPYLDQIKAKKIVVSEVNTPDAAISMGEACVQRA